MSKDLTSHTSFTSKRKHQGADLEPNASAGHPCSLHVSPVSCVVTTKPLMHSYSHVSGWSAARTYTSTHSSSTRLRQQAPSKHRSSCRPRPYPASSTLLSSFSSSSIKPPRHLASLIRLKVEHLRVVHQSDFSRWSLVSTTFRQSAHQLRTTRSLSVRCSILLHPISEWIFPLSGAW